MASLSRQVLTKKLQLPKPSRGSHSHGAVRDYSMLPWTNYFSGSMSMKTAGGEFNVYYAGNTGDTLVLCLHGGGFSALSWAVACRDMLALVAVRFEAMDMRGHGLTRSCDDTALDTETLVDDVVAVYEALHPDRPDVVLIGHSMGGAIAVHTAFSERLPVVGLVVIDVVEGTALEALSSMNSVLRSRPPHFATMEKAIEWAVRSGQTHNLEAARVSMPGMLNPTTTASVVSEESIATPGLIAEEDEDNETNEPTEARRPATKSDDALTHGTLTWRIDLAATEPHWRGWFEGLSSKFLGCPCAKLLLLAGVDRLDKNLTVGQMQGKFQMHVMDKSGHCVHEDQPEQFAQVIATFLVRNRFAAAKDDFLPVLPGC